jgi:hypothetical protein
LVDLTFQLFFGQNLKDIRVAVDGSHMEKSQQIPSITISQAKSFIEIDGT